MRIIAIDYGMARTGVAVSDPSGLIATPLEFIPSGNRKKLYEGIFSVIEKYSPEKIIIGLPIRTDGKEGSIVSSVRELEKTLKEKYNIEVITLNEMFTTVIASQKLHERDMNAKKQRSQIDSAAAAVLLQDYLDRNRK